MSYAPASQELIEDVRRTVATWLLCGFSQPVALVLRPRTRNVATNTTEIASVWHCVSQTHHHWMRRIVPGEFVTLDEMPQACRDLMAAGFLVISPGDANGKLPPEFPEGVLGARDIP